jgi:nucleoside-diphosphate-sugar epimerase
MNVLLIGGTRFVGYQLAWRLLAAGHQVTLLNRGRTPDNFGARVGRLVADRTDPQQLARALGQLRFDAAVDFAAYTGDDARHAVELLGNNGVGHYVFISSGQVYLVRENCPRPARESDYAGPVMPEPLEAHDREEWLYGVRKRDAEDALAAAWEAQKFPATRLRIPMVNGERDYYRRIESYLWRILDGGPILLPKEDIRAARHVYGQDVARAIVQVLGNSRTFGEAYNLAQDEIPTVPELVELLAEFLGAPPRILQLPGAKLQAAGVSAEKISPFNVKWMSFLEPAKAKKELHFRHEPLTGYLDKIVSNFVNHPPQTPPENYALRPAELALAATAQRATSADSFPLKDSSRCRQ